MAVTVSRTKPAPVVIKSHASFRGAGTPLPDSHIERAPIQHQPRRTFTLQTEAPGRPAPSASSLLHFTSPSPAPSPAARAQKQSRTQEAPYSAATRCRLLEASKTARAQAQAGYHTTRASTRIRGGSEHGCAGQGMQVATICRSCLILSCILGLFLGSCHR